MFGRLGGLFRKGQKKESTEESPDRVRIVHYSADGSFKTKRQSALTAMDISRSPMPSPLLPPKTPKKKRGRQHRLPVAPDVLPPTLSGKLNVSTEIGAKDTPAAASNSSPEQAAGESVLPIPAAARKATQTLCEILLDQILKEDDLGRQRKLLAISTVSTSSETAYYCTDISIVPQPGSGKRSKCCIVGCEGHGGRQASGKVR